MKINEYFNQSEECESWLDLEKSILEREEAYLSYWFHEKGVGIVITANRSGEFHAYSDGTTFFYVSDLNDEKIANESSSTNNFQVILNTYERYKSFVLGKKN